MDVRNTRDTAWDVRDTMHTTLDIRDTWHTTWDVRDTGAGPGTPVAPNIESVKALNSCGVRPASVFCTTANVTNPFTNNAIFV